MIFASLFAAALAFTPADAKAVLDLTSAFVRDCPRRDAGTPGGGRAAAWLLGKVPAAGGGVDCDRFTAPAPSGERNFINLYRPFERRPGAPWIVLVSHYDTKPGADCPGANDGAATSCLLVHLAEILSAVRDFDRNVMLVWTDAEECQGARYSENDGFQGSKRAAARLKEKKYAVEAVYVLDMLGDADLGISLPANGTPLLAERVLAAAKTAGLPAGMVAKSEFKVLDDHVAFLEAGFPAVDLIDFEYGSAPGLNDYWHTPQDTPDKLSADSLLSVGKLMCRLLEFRP